MKIRYFILTTFLFAVINSYSQDNSSSTVFRNKIIRDYVIDLFNFQYDSVLLYKNDSKDLFEDLPIDRRNENRKVDNFTTATKIPQNRISDLKTIMEDKNTYSEAYIDKRGAVHGLECPSMIVKYNLSVNFYKGSKCRLILLYSSLVNKFTIYYENDNEIFMVYDVCINSYYWNNIIHILGSGW